jgi:predicted nuclease of restriction endonuclease-like RecB superfamily
MKSLEDLYIQAQVNAILKSHRLTSYISVQDLCIDIMASYMEKRSSKKIHIVIKARHPSILDVIKVIKIEDFKIDTEYLNYMVESCLFICENKTYLSLSECLV